MANFFQRIFNNKDKVENREFDEWTNPIMGTLSLNTSSSYTSSKALKLSAVYRCINLISDSIASLPLNPYEYKGDWKYIAYDNPLYNILNIQPNSFMSKFTFMKLVVVNMLTKGNAYILIDRDTKTGQVKSLNLLEPDNIAVLIIKGDVKYEDKYNNKIYDKSQIIHILNYTTSGLIGISTLSYASTSLAISYNSEQHASNFFLGGASLAGILRPIAGVNITKDKAIKAKSDFINALSSDLGGKSNSIVVLDSGLEYQPITISPKDSQLLESRTFGVIDICRWFSVPPSLAFDQSGKYSTSEQQQLDYLQNCLSPIIEKIENEFFRKIYLPSEYNTI
jgi:HK97 family phage portal protein